VEVIDRQPFEKSHGKPGIPKNDHRNSLGEIKNVIYATLEHHFFLALPGFRWDFELQPEASCFLQKPIETCFGGFLMETGCGGPRCGAAKAL
jgi:hypothetical protein